MRCKTQPPSLESTRDERVAKLFSFISHHLAVDAAAGSGICLIARSLDSPVFKAAAQATAEIPDPVPVRALLAGVDAKALEGLGPKWEVRVLRTPRLLDAHEQLTAGEACWHGDCLRRDPGKRDFFEQFNSDGGQALAWSEISFARLWAVAEPVAVIASQAAAREPDTASLAALASETSAGGDTQLDAS